MGEGEKKIEVDLIKLDRHKIDKKCNLGFNVVTNDI